MSKQSNENYLEKIPCRNSEIKWKCGENSVISLEIENKGVFNKIAQKLFRKPKISYVHLDEMGSFVWPLIDGERNIIEIGEIVKEKFGVELEPEVILLGD